MDKITFCINTARNELNHIQLLFKSLQKNLSTLKHEILVFVDSDNQGTTEWLVEQKSIFPNLKILKNPLPVCYGYARNINEMFKYATHDIVSYLQSDMVVCKNYDVEVLKHLKPNMVLSSTRIEPPLHGNSGEKITYDFGLDPQEFNIESFTEYAESQKQDKITEYFFAPFTLYKEVWNSIGGHDTRFRRSREDSDVLNRLILNGVQISQTWEAIVYHFTCTSSRGINWFDKNNKEAQSRTYHQAQADQIELARMNRKWGKFSHGSPQNYFYNITANINVDIPNMGLLRQIEQFFSKTYINDSDVYKTYTQQNEHSLANHLLNFTLEDWEKYGYMYNQDNIKDRIVLSPLSKIEDVIISFNLSSINVDNFNSFIVNLQEIIHYTDEGEYEFEGFNIKIINKENIIREKIKVSNPEVKLEDKYIIL